MFRGLRGLCLVIQSHTIILLGPPSPAENYPSHATLGTLTIPVQMFSRQPFSQRGSSTRVVAWDMRHGLMRCLGMINHV